MTYVVLSKPGCSKSIEAIELLRAKKLKTRIYQADTEDQKNEFTNQEFKNLFGQDATYPRVYKDGVFIGGCDDLVEYIKSY